MTWTPKCHKTGTRFERVAQMDSGPETQFVSGTVHIGVNVGVTFQVTDESATMHRFLMPER